MCLFSWSTNGELLQGGISLSQIKSGDISHQTGISPNCLWLCIISSATFSFYILISMHISRLSIKDDRAVVQHWFCIRKYCDFQSFQFCLYCQRFCLPENQCLCMYHLVSIISDHMILVYPRRWIWAGAHGARLRSFVTHSPLHLIPEEFMRFDRVPQNWIDEDCHDHKVLCLNKWVFAELIRPRYLSSFSLVANQAWHSLLA